MICYDQDSAKCLVFTYKEGLLATIAHDLILNVACFSLRISGKNNTVVGDFDPASLEVLCAAVNGREKPGNLSVRACSQI